MTFDHEYVEATVDRWYETQLPERVVSRLVSLELVIHNLNAVSRALEADEQATRQADADHLDYVAMHPDVRKGLRRSRQLMQAEVERRLDELHSALVKSAGAA